MKETENYWVDENGNKWTKSIYVKEQAEEDSKTLKNCHNCTDCINCTSCDNCIRCTWCTDCTNCTNCTRCTDCTNCTNCAQCTNYVSSNNCTGCAKGTGHYRNKKGENTIPELLIIDIENLLKKRLKNIEEKLEKLLSSKYENTSQHRIAALRKLSRTQDQLNILIEFIENKLNTCSKQQENNVLELVIQLLKDIRGSMHDKDY